MSVTSLEKFGRQFSVGKAYSVSDILRLAQEGNFVFYVPTEEQPDAETLISRVEECLPHLSEVVRSPYIILKSEYREVRSELSGALTPQGIRMTMKDKRLWKKKDGLPKPESVYAKTNEDEYGTYENRLVKALIDRAIFSLQMPLDYAKDGVKNLYGAYFQSASLNKLDLIKILDADTFKECDKNSFDSYKKLYYLRAKLMQLRGSAFYKILSVCTPFNGEVNATNLFVHNPHYSSCFRLWLFLRDFGVGLSGLGETEKKSLYAAFIFLATCEIYVRLGFRVVRDVKIEGLPQTFSVSEFVLENSEFRVVIDASAENMTITVQCLASKLQQRTSIALHTDVSEPEEIGDRFVVSLYRTGYRDNAACVVPGNKNSLRDLESIVRCTVLTLDADRSVYGKVCLICGSQSVEDKGGYFVCPDCGAAYSFPSDRKLWLNRFRVLGREEV